jgi:hypothetical protein
MKGGMWRSSSRPASRPGIFAIWHHLWRGHLRCLPDGGYGCIPTVSLVANCFFSCKAGLP